ncbi:hypothetical protein LOTGIDRAFT_202951 [Lottia gigantea]|uniref:Tetraspanin n=1 Tax=Lottia gigantea TaxID=225164 RepID=V4CRD4_LOTGI|nr:hypothetical protein LOTGIDRAFT_202951 [Lottia gigantea]ESP05060.1 hypothetical protein LOTGIDRAFT_202951 [Lottia gigantea]
MALGSCHTCIKYLMFAFNFLFWLLGCAILGVGIWLRVDQDVAQYVNKSDGFNIFYTLSYLLIAVGIIIMIIGFLGCCGAIRESQCMLGMFFVCLFIIFAILLGAGIWAVVAKDSFRDWTGMMLDDAVKNYYKDEHSKNFMDTVQNGFKCCGSYKGVVDYGFATIINLDVPEACDKYPLTGCNEKYYAFMAEYCMIVAGIAIGIAVILILGMIFSMVLCCAIRDVNA